MSSHDLLYRRSCLFLGYVNDIDSFLSGYRIFRHVSSERFLRHKYAWSDSVNFVISSLQALLLGLAIGVDADGIHMVISLTTGGDTLRYRISPPCCGAKNVSNLCCLLWLVFWRFDLRKTQEEFEDTKGVLVIRILISVRRGAQFVPIGMPTVHQT